MTPVSNPQEAIERMLQEKRLSSKINYDVLKNLNKDLVSLIDQYFLFLLFVALFNQFLFFFSEKVNFNSQILFCFVSFIHYFFFFQKK